MHVLYSSTIPGHISSCVLVSAVLHSVNVWCSALVLSAAFCVLLFVGLCLCFSCLAMATILFVLMQTDFGTWLPAATFLQLLAVARLDGSIFKNLHLIRRLGQLYNDLVDASSAALLAGLYCPGLHGRVPGTLLLEGSLQGLFLADVFQRLGFTSRDVRDLDTVIQPLVPDAPGQTFAAWRCLNEDTLVWLSLQLFLASPSMRTPVSYHLLQRPGKTAFVVNFQVENLRAAFVFQTAIIVIEDSD